MIIGKHIIELAHASLSHDSIILYFLYHILDYLIYFPCNECEAKWKQDIMAVISILIHGHKNPVSYYASLHYKENIYLLQ